MLSRLKFAARFLIKGDIKKNKRNPIPAITLEEVAEIKQFFPREKFFIFGHARSGTTLLLRLVRLHPEVHGNYQAHFFTRQPLLNSLVNTPEAEEWLTRKSNRWNQGRDLSPLVLRSTADFIMERDAAREGKIKLAKLLVKAGAKLYTKGPGGRTPSEIASENKHPELAQALRVAAVVEKPKAAKAPQKAKGKHK